MFESIAIALLSVVGFIAGLCEIKSGSLPLGVFAAMVCGIAFVVNLLSL